MPFKYTMFINVATTGGARRRLTRLGGVSESVYHTLGNLAEAGQQFERLMDLRQKLLPKECTIVGYRVTDTTRVAGSVLSLRSWGGTYDSKVDQPKQCLYIKSKGTTGNRLQYCLRFIPDEMVEGGEFQGKDDYNILLQNFALGLNGFHQIARKTTALARDVVTITTQGVLRPLTALTGVAAGGKVYVLRPRTLVKGKHGGLYKVLSVADNDDISLDGWQGGNAIGGKVRLYDTNTNVYQGPHTWSEIGTREVGEPNFPLAGRR